MIDTSAVLNLMIELDGEIDKNREKASAICQAACEELSSQLKSEEYASLFTVIFACASVSLYRYYLSLGLSDDSFESVKAGDVTVKRSASLIIQMANDLKNNALSGAMQYFNDISFAFKAV